MAVELARRQSAQSEPNEPDALVLGRVMAESGYFKDIKKAAEAAVKILAGREMGFGPAASVMGVHIIEGKPSIAAGLMASAVKRSGKYDYRIAWLPDDKRPTSCTVRFLQLVAAKWELLGESTFTWADAEAAGLAHRQTWKSYPRNMLFARALSNGVRWYCPDVFQGAVYTHEELGADVNEDGEFVPKPGRIVTTKEVLQARALAEPDTADWGDPTVLPPLPKDRGDDATPGTSARSITATGSQTNANSDEPPTFDALLAEEEARTTRPSPRAKKADQPEADLLAELAARAKREIEVRTRKGFETLANAAEPVTMPTLGAELRKALEKIGLVSTEARIRLVAAVFGMTPSELTVAHAHALIGWTNTAEAAAEAQALVADVRPA